MATASVACVWTRAVDGWIMGFWDGLWFCDKYLFCQVAFVTPTRHRGEVCTRFVVVNPQTTVDDLQRVIDSMK